MDIEGKLKYVGLELMRKNAKSTDTPEVGLFRGIRTRTEKDVVLTLILLGDKDTPDAIRGLNKDVFNIMTIMLKHGNPSEMMVFKNTEEDQKEAYEIIDVIIKSLKKDGMMLKSDPEIVDTTKYIEIDTEFFGASKKVNSESNFNSAANRNTGPSWQEKQATEKKEKERQEKMRWTPFKIRRKSKKPLIKDLNAVKKKILAISSGEYECKLPKTAGDEEEENKKTGTANK